MLCPECRQPQVIVEYEGIELDVCIDGHGVWFDDQELRLLFETVRVPELLHDLEQKMKPVDDPALGPKRRCPRCEAWMDQVLAAAHPEPVTLDRCPHGDGLWFDDDELERVIAHGLDPDHPALDKIRSHLYAFEEEGPAADDAAPPPQTD